MTALVQAQDRAPAADGMKLMPMPAAIRLNEGRLQLGTPFTIAVQGHSDQRLTDALTRMARRLENQTGVQVPRSFGESDPAMATLTIQCRGAGNAVPQLREDESYSLEVTPGHAVLKADAAVGILRGLETFLQLVRGDRDGYFLPAVSIQDQPRFPWRGLLIDVSRHYQPVEVLKRNLDAMAAVKLNVFHWHLTDDQGFRIESRKFPRLHQMGSDGQYYTQAQVREIVEYASQRGIRVVPEFDMPGHTTSWFAGYPELASGPGPYLIERQFGVFDPVMDPSREQTYRFLDKFIAEMAKLFPDPYLHIGGDENNGKQWSQNPKIRAFMQSRQLPDTQALQAYFNRRLQKILQKHGKKLVGWDEILHPDLPPDTVIQSWRGQKYLAASTQQGFNGILSAGYYLDHFRPAEYHYSNDPLPADASLNPEQAALILGGEACMWAEFLSAENIDSRIWPRAAAIAERLWSPRSVNQLDDMYRRLESVSLELESLGLTHRSNLDRTLRRLAGTNQVGPLATLAGASEPLGLGPRSRLEKTTQLTPLIRMADALPPESLTRRELATMVDRFLADAPRFATARDELTARFTDWQSLQSMAPPVEPTPMECELEPRTRDLAALGATGLEAIRYLVDRTAPPPGWKETRLALLDDAAKPKSLLNFSWLPSLRLLVVAASQAGELGSVAPEQWRKELTTAAEKK